MDLVNNKEMSLEILRLFGKVPTTVEDWEVIEDMVTFVVHGNTYRACSRMQARKEKKAA